MANYAEASDSIDNDDDFFVDDKDDVGKASSDKENSKLYTERRRRIEDHLELVRLKDQLGIYDDYSF